MHNPDTQSAILLTATICPNGMSETKLQNPEIRKKQYIEAVEFYLKHTGMNIVLCENSGQDIYNYINSSNKNSRLESICFDSNTNDINFGKGYGEAKIINYAITHSSFIRKAGRIIKITGRIKILNINTLIAINSRLHNKKNIVIGEFSNKDWFKTICFTSDVRILQSVIGKYMELIESENDHSSIETIFAKELFYNNNYKCRLFHPHFDGICACYNEPYANLPVYQRKLNHYNAIWKISDAKCQKKKTIYYFLLWMINLFRYKIGF